MSNKAIAHHLGISPRTVEGHLNHVFDKLGIESRTELVHYALASRLLGRDTDGRGPSDGADRDTVSGPAHGGTDAGRGISAARSPWTDSRFWLLQLTVLALALVRLAVTVAFGLDTDDAVLEVSTVALFVVPVVVGSLNFGLTGGLATVAWVAVLDVPRMVEVADHGVSLALWSEVVQLVVLLAMALLIGWRVTAETRFREQADAARTARLQAEVLYQDMFESNRSPILVVDGDGRVVGANAAAGRVFGTPTDRAPRLASRDRATSRCGAWSTWWGRRPRRSCSPACSMTGGPPTPPPPGPPMATHMWPAGMSTTSASVR